MAFTEIPIVLLFLLGLFVLLYARTKKENAYLVLQLNDLLSRKQSLSTKYGKMTEQFMPFMQDYPYNPEAFRFIGSPIDGVQFEKDKIVFVEFKAGSHALNGTQKGIKYLVENKRVEFREVRMKE